MGWLDEGKQSRVRCDKCGSVSEDAFWGKKGVRQAGGSMSSTEGEALCWKCSGCGVEAEHAHMWGPGDKTLETYDRDWRDWHPDFHENLSWELMREELRNAVMNGDTQKRDTVLIAMTAEVWHALRRLRQ